MHLASTVRRMRYKSIFVFALFGLLGALRCEGQCLFPGVVLNDTITQPGGANACAIAAAVSDVQGTMNAFSCGEKENKKKKKKKKKRV